MDRAGHRRGAALTRNQRIALWVAFPLAGVLWAALRYRSSWFYYDEWPMLDRTRGGLGGLFEGHQGHLEIQNFLVYRIQRSWFGLGSRGLVYAGYLAGLAALQVSVALVLRRLRVPDVLALVAAAMITFFGPGAQNAVFEFQQGLNLALALCLFAAFVALRDDHTENGAITIGALLLVAVAADSGLAAVGLVYVGILVVLRWPRSFWLVSLAPAAVAGAAWLLFGERAHTVPTSWDVQWSFIQRLLSLAAAGLVGGGERYLPGLADRPPAYPLTTHQTALLVATAAAVVIAYGWRLLDRTLVVNLAAGLVTALVGTAAIARERAWIIEPLKLPGSRYLQWIALFLLLAVLPPLVRVLTPSTDERRHLAVTVATVAIALVFVVNLTSFRKVVDVDEEVGAQASGIVAQVVDVLVDGCPAGRDPDREFEAVPFVTVGLVQDLLEDGSLPESYAEPASDALRDLVCPADPP